MTEIKKEEMMPRCLLRYVDKSEVGYCYTPGTWHLARRKSQLNIYSPHSFTLTFPLIHATGLLAYVAFKNCYVQNFTIKSHFSFVSRCCQMLTIVS